jgi:energy-coupling factor transporter ATP-binding protein EcfA2
MVGLRLRGWKRSAAEERARAALRLVGMEQLARRRHHELSGGERRRAALARILALESQVIVLDEPTSGLDRESERIIEEQIRSVNRDHGVTVVLASHNLRQAVALSTRVLTLSDGRVLPESLDNVMSGTMQRSDRGYAYRDVRGWRYTFDAAQLAEGSQAVVGDSEAPVQIAIPSSQLIVKPDAAGDGSEPTGMIDSVRQNEGSCRLRVRLEAGPSLHAELDAEEYRRLGLNLGVRVALAVKPYAVRVMPTARVSH